MTERQNKTGLQEDYFIDKKTDGFLDKISKSKWVRALFGAGVMASSSVTLTACDNTSPPAEVAPINEAVLSGVIDQNSAEKLTGSSKQIVDNSLAFIANESAGNENFVPGTERIYAVAKGADSFAWYFAGFKNEDGTVGLKVTHYCDSWVKDNENCQGIGKDLLIKLVEGNRVYHWTDNNDEQHPILLIDKDNNPVAFDIRGSSYVERVANSDGFLDKIVSIGAMSVEAAAPEVTVEPTATLPVVETATPEPTATATEAAEVVYAPEGFSVGEYGMLRDPATGKDVLTFNPEVDWQKFREDFIKGLWQYNVDWCDFTGECNDSINYSADSFYEAALEGKVFNIGVPIRSNIDWDDFDKTTPYTNESVFDTRTSNIGLKMVSVKLDNINLQILDPARFPGVVGNDTWLDSNNESFSSGPAPMSLYKSVSQSTSYFSVDDSGQLSLSLGAFNMMSVDLIPTKFVVGSFETGIGSKADLAVSDNLDRVVSILHNSDLGRVVIKNLNGEEYKLVGISPIDQAVIEDGIKYFVMNGN